MASADDVQKLAALARLSLPENRLEQFAREFDSIISYIGTLEKLSLETGVQDVPVVHNVMREDGEPHEKGAHTKGIVAQFPDKEGNYLKVKQILSHD